MVELEAGDVSTVSHLLLDALVGTHISIKS